jgi:hypothetical protein
MIGSRPVHVQSRSKSDVIDRFFTWGETTFCPHEAIRDIIPLEEDNLDFVFEHVELLVCRENVAEVKMSRGHPVTIQRDNSLIEACNSIQAKIVKSKETSLRRDDKPVGDKRDVLDYCFDHVESYACGDNATGNLDLTEKNSHPFRETIKTSASPSPKEEMEDEVHLYYRPSVL